MNWKFKSVLQNVIALLPGELSYELYYQMQRRFGGLRSGRYSPKTKLIAGVEIWNRISESGGTGSGKTFFEIGTGRVPVVPLANFLMGADKTITVDLNSYVKEELCFEMLQYIYNNQQEIRDIFGDYLVEKNLDILLEYYSQEKFVLEGFLRVCNIVYRAPLDARATSIEGGSVDYFISYAVFEHIPEDVLKGIVTEGNRLLAEDGLHVHRIDYGDHFSHSDNAISAINFLQYSDATWKYYAGNRYMYMNRLRHDDFEELFKSAGCKMVSELRDTDERVTAVLAANSLKLDEQFSSKGNEILSITSAWFVMKK